MFWLYHLEVCKWCCLQFWPSAAKNMFDRWSNLVWKWKQHSEPDLSYRQHYQDIILKPMSVLLQVLSWTCTPSLIPHYWCHCVISLLSLHNFDKFCHSSLFPAQIFFVFGHVQSQSHLHLLLFSWSWREKNFLVGIVSHVVVGFLETNWCELLSI